MAGEYSEAAKQAQIRANEILQKLKEIEVEAEEKITTNLREIKGIQLKEKDPANRIKEYFEKLTTLLKGNHTALYRIEVINQFYNEVMTRNIPRNAKYLLGAYLEKNTPKLINERDVMRELGILCEALQNLLKTELQWTGKLTGDLKGIRTELEKVKEELRTL